MMEPTSATTGQSRIAVSQRELLALILACAADCSASFTTALAATERATGVERPRAMTRELLSDLAIRDWIELRLAGRTGVEAPIERLRYELELAADRNWDERAQEPRARFALTAKGRERVLELQGSAGARL
jgi:hypothetical protein